MPGFLSVLVDVVDYSSNQGMCYSIFNRSLSPFVIDFLLLCSAFHSFSKLKQAFSSVVTAIQQIANERATLGAAQSRLEVASAQMQVQYENLEAAISRIRDVDVAEETSKMARTQVMMQAGVSVLAQANQAPQIALKLLG